MSIDHTKTPTTISVFIVDDHPLVRHGIKQLLHTEPGMEVCGEAERVDEAIRKLAFVNPHAVLVDLDLPEISGIELIRFIKLHRVEMKTIVISTFDQCVYGSIAAEAGADHYINKHRAMEEIILAIHEVVEPGPVGKAGFSREAPHWFG